jgi:DNA-binding winged helix-turn-helix (wHTH) protein
MAADGGVGSQGEGGQRELRFGRFRIDSQRRALLVDGEPARLGARAFDILLALAERRERAVAKNELLEIVWPRLVVEENNLQVHISALRKLLGPDVIATIPGRGYRFAVPLDGDDTPLPAAAAAPQGSPGNLPVEQPPLYGRAAEVDAGLALLQTHRLVTIVGAGGIGKTRVAQTVAQALRAQHADGVWLVELAPLADAALVPASVAQALKLQLRGVRALHDELVDALQPQQLLLVLDNCEHLLDAIGQLAQALLTRTPQLRLLVTSQEPLRRKR